RSRGVSGKREKPRMRRRRSSGAGSTASISRRISTWPERAPLPRASWPGPDACLRGWGSRSTAVPRVVSACRGNKASSSTTAELCSSWSVRERKRGGVHGGGWEDMSDLRRSGRGIGAKERLAESALVYQVGWGQGSGGCGGVGGGFVSSFHGVREERHRKYAT